MLELVIEGVDGRRAVSRLLAATMRMLERLQVTPWKAWTAIPTLENPNIRRCPCYPTLPLAAGLRHLHTLSIPAQPFSP